MKINFIVTDSFLRTKAKTDPFYDPIIKAIDGRPDIECKIFVSHKGIACGYPAERLDDFKALDVCSVWFYRFCRLIAWRVPAWKIYRLFGWLARPLFARKFNADVIITQSGQFAELFEGLLPSTRVIDIQHGVIFSRHNGYFDKAQRLLPIYQVLKKREFWVYGQGFADCFFKHPDNAKDLKGRVKVIGDVLGCSRGDEVAKSEASKKIIAVSLQFTKDFRPNVLQSFADDLSKVFEKMESSGLYLKFEVVMRHHPRFDNSFDMVPILKRFPWLAMSEESTSALIGKAAYHITYMSTSAFEYAAEGVPTLFTASENNRIAIDMMYGEFNYPIPLDFAYMEHALIDQNEMARQSELVKAWYDRFYSKFDERHCLSLLYGVQK